MTEAGRAGSGLPAKPVPLGLSLLQIGLGQPVAPVGLGVTERIVRLLEQGIQPTSGCE